MPNDLWTFIKRGARDGATRSLNGGRDDRVVRNARQREHSGQAAVARRAENSGKHNLLNEPNEDEVKFCDGNGDTAATGAPDDLLTLARGRGVILEFLGGTHAAAIALAALGVNSRTGAAPGVAQRRVRFCQRDRLGGPNAGQAGGSACGEGHYSPGCVSRRQLSATL